MIRKIEIHPNPENLDINKKQIQFFVDYLDTKYSGWQEFALTNKGKVRLLIYKNSVRFMEKYAKIGELINLLDKVNPNWERFLLNNTTYKIIETYELKKGMLFRYSQQDVENIYNIVVETNDIEAICASEGYENTWKLNFEKQKPYTFKVLCEKVENAEEVEEVFKTN